MADFRAASPPYSDPTENYAPEDNRRGLYSGDSPPPPPSAFTLSNILQQIKFLKGPKTFRLEGMLRSSWGTGGYYTFRVEETNLDYNKTFRKLYSSLIEHQLGSEKPAITFYPRFFQSSRLFEFPPPPIEPFMEKAIPPNWTFRLRRSPVRCVSVSSQIFLFTHFSIGRLPCFNRR